MARYGAPQDSPDLDRNFPLLEGAIHHTYAYKGSRIRAAFLPPNGPAVRLDYSKIVQAGVNPVIQDLSKMFEGYFMAALGQKMWQRNVGATLWLRSKILVRVELSAAHEYETKFKAEKEHKAVPQF